MAMYLNNTKITCMVVFLLLRLAFHTEEPDGVSDAFNIFMFTDIYLAAGTNESMIANRWDT